VLGAFLCIEAMAGVDAGTASVSSADEQMPLLGHQPSVYDVSFAEAPSFVSIEHKESVYSFMLFQPPLSRRRSGHYCTTEVFLALALLVLNVTLQVGLTLIAGSHIVERSIEFKTSLVSGEDSTTPWDKAIKVSTEEGGRALEIVGDTLGTSAAVVDGSCCNGAECAELNLPCCDRSGAKPHTPHQPMRKNYTEADVQKTPGGSNATFLAIQKPKAKKEERRKRC